MNSPTSLYRPASGFDWANDDDDEFDLDEFKFNHAEDIKTAQTLNELGPLHKSDLADDQTPPPTDASDLTKEVAPWTVPTDASPCAQHSPASNSVKLPGDPSLYYSSNSEDWIVQQDQGWWRPMKVMEDTAAPAYPELSWWVDAFGVWRMAAGFRSHYYENFRNTKVAHFQGAPKPGQTMLYKSSPLREAIRAQEDESVPELARCDTPDDEEIELAVTPPDSPLISSSKEMHKESADNSVETTTVCDIANQTADTKSITYKDGAIAEDHTTPTFNHSSEDADTVDIPFLEDFTFTTYTTLINTEGDDPESLYPISTSTSSTDKGYNADDEAISPTITRCKMHSKLHNKRSQPRKRFPLERYITQRHTSPRSARHQHLQEAHSRMRNRAQELLDSNLALNQSRLQKGAPPHQPTTTSPRTIAVSGLLTAATFLVAWTF